VAPLPKNGVAGPPLFGQGVASATPYGRSGVAEATPRPLGVVQPPRKPPRKKNGFVPLGVAGPPPRAWGGCPVWGGRSHPLAKKGVVRPPQFWASGWLQPPPISPFFFFFFFLWGNFTFPPPPNFHRFTQNPLIRKSSQIPPLNFQILSLRTILEKSAHYTLHSKTTPFWARPKRRSFGPFLFSFFFLIKKNPKRKEKKKEKKRKRVKSGVAGATRLPKIGVAHPQNPKPIFFVFFLAFRGGRTTPKGLGWLRPPPYGRFGHPLAKNGVVRPPHFWAKGGSSHPAIPPSSSSSFFF
jgi:hypothetical protein